MKLRIQGYIEGRLEEQESEVGSDVTQVLVDVVSDHVERMQKFGVDDPACKELLELAKAMHWLASFGEASPEEIAEKDRAYEVERRAKKEVENAVEKIAPGDTVFVLNYNPFRREYFIEGEATFKRWQDESNQQAMVVFEVEPGVQHERFVDFEAQPSREDAQAHVDAMNESVRGGSKE